MDRRRESKTDDTDDLEELRSMWMERVAGRGLEFFND